MDRPEHDDETDETREIPAGHESGVSRPGEDPAPAEDEESAAAIADCLKLLDEVWPGEAAAIDEMPRELGRFRILGELGRGGFGVVFLADDPMLGRKVALKVPRVEILTGSESWRRFLREVWAAARLDHPNLVPLLEAGAIGPVGYIVSAYIPGPSLEQWLRDHPAGTQPRWAARLVMALARAIHHAHGRNILHRDLKPGNVLLDPGDLPAEPADPSSWVGIPAESWIPRICDFGLAKLFEIEEEETRSRVVCGSPPYMAPEQADSRRDEIGRATDVYGLGAILYELLTGRPPFGGKGNLETLRRVASEEPVPPRRRRPGLPRDLETICLKCLAKRPEGRYASAAELADDLERFLEGRSIAARPVPWWERAGRWARRYPAAAALALAVMLAVGAGLCGLLWHSAVLREKNEELRREALRAEDQAREADEHRKEAELRAVELRRQFAGSQLFQAHQSIASGDFEPARRRIEAAAAEFGPPRPPTFAWSYLKETVHDRTELLVGHRVSVECVAVSPDGQGIASGDIQGHIRIWGLADGRCRLELTGGAAGIDRLAWSRDGRTLASADRDSGLIRIWDLAAGRCRGHLEGTGTGQPVWWLAFDEDGRRIRAIRSRPGADLPPFGVWLVDGGTGEFPLRPEAGAGDRGDDRLTHLVALLDRGSPTGPAPAAFPGGEGAAKTPRIAFTNDRAMAVVAVDDRTFEVYRDRTRFRLAVIRTREEGHLVVLFDQFDKRDTPTRAEQKRLEELATGLVPGWRAGRSSRGRVAQAEGSAVFAPGPGADELVVWDEAHDQLNRFDPARGLEPIRTGLEPLADVRSLCLGPGGTTLVLGFEHGGLRFWNLRALPRFTALRGHAPKEAWAVAFSPDGRMLASGGDDGRVRLWDVASWRERAVIHEHEALITSLAFSPDGKTLGIGSFDRSNQVMLWDLEAGRPLRSLRGHRAQVRCVVFSPDGLTLASSGDEDSMFLWDPRTDRPKATVSLESPFGAAHLAFSLDGRTIATSRGDRFGLVDLASGRLRLIPMDDQVGPLIFSRDGSQITLGLRDGSIRTWDLVDNREVRKVEGHAGLVLGLALSPDGVTLASAGVDGTVRLWDVATGQELLCLTDCRVRVNSVAFGCDGQMLAAAHHSGAVTIWDARPKR